LYTDAIQHPSIGPERRRSEARSFAPRYITPSTPTSPYTEATERCDANPLGASRIPVRSGRWSFARGLPSPAPERSEGRPPGALRFPRGGEPQSLAGPPGRVASLFPAPPVRVSGAAPVIPPPRPLAGLPRRPAGFRPRCPRPAPERCGACRASRPLSRARS